MPELANILIGIGQFYGLIFKFCQVSVVFYKNWHIFLSEMVSISD